MIVTSQISLRCTGGTHLFQAGVERKSVKEFTGHRSDAIDAYQITSEEQRESLSDILACKGTDVPEAKREESAETVVKSKSSSREFSKCTCSCVHHETSPTDSIVTVVKEIISKNMKKGTTNIKIEIELSSK